MPLKKNQKTFFKELFKNSVLWKQNFKSGSQVLSVVIICSTNVSDHVLKDLSC